MGKTTGAIGSGRGVDDPEHAVSSEPLKKPHKKSPTKRKRQKRVVPRPRLNEN